MKCKTDTMLKKHILKKTFFIPKKEMKTVMDYIEGRNNLYERKKRNCDNNLFLLQRTRLNTFDYSLYSKMNWITMFSLACHKALYANDWDKLLYLLTKVPKWKFPRKEHNRYAEYVFTRYLTILLMYHPTSQAEGLLCEYLHMAWGCRSDQDKKAVLKVLLHLPKRLPKPRLAKSDAKKKDVGDSD